MEASGGPSLVAPGYRILAASVVQPGGGQVGSLARRRRNPALRNSAFALDVEGNVTSDSEMIVSRDLRLLACDRCRALARASGQPSSRWSLACF